MDHGERRVTDNKDGNTHVWNDTGWGESDDIKSWYQERVDDLMKQLK
jgi:hypothetical protein